MGITSVRHGETFAWCWVYGANSVYGRAVTPDACRSLFASQPVARLATIGGGKPHIVPIVFAVDGDRIVTAVDHKPKASTRLRRLANVEENQAVAVLADEYRPDWEAAVVGAHRRDGAGHSGRAQPRRGDRSSGGEVPAVPGASAEGARHRDRRRTLDRVGGVGMRFTKQHWAGIADGSIPVAFRRWRRPTVVVGRVYRTGGGRVEVRSVEEIDPGRISPADVSRTGHESAPHIRSQLRGEENWPVFRIEFRVLDEPDPRAVLANNTRLSEEDVAEIDRRLARLDRASRHGPWTTETLGLIRDHPEVRAPDLAAMVGRETQPFKLDVRKLKNLGLTLSLNPGYRLSPRGEAYLRARELSL